jgi:hypothetical protein
MGFLFYPNQKNMATPKTPVPTELYTAKTMFTLGGGSAAVWIFTTILAWVFEVDTEKYKWIGLCIALALSYIGALKLKSISIQLVTVAFFNGLLIYITAVGIDSINQGIRTQKSGEEVKAALIPFTTSKPWWPSASLLDSIHLGKKQNVEVFRRYTELKIQNTTLQDSLQEMANTLQMNVQGNEILQKYIDSNKQLSFDLEACRNKPVEKVAETTKDSEAANDAQKQSEKLRTLLTDLKKMNGVLIKEFGNYIKGGQGNPDSNLETLRKINDDIYSFRLQLIEVNSQIDKVSGLDK